MSDAYYELAQICENGHVINDRARERIVHNQKYCEKCGYPSLTTCPSCDSEIRGSLVVPGVGGIPPAYQTPSFCHACGKPYPWTKSTLSAAEELADELDDLSKQERDELKQSIDDLVRDTPRTEIAITRFKKIMKKAGKEGYEPMKSILTDIISETARKSLFGA